VDRGYYLTSYQTAVNSIFNFMGKKSVYTKRKRSDSSCKSGQASFVVGFPSLMS